MANAGRVAIVPQDDYVSTKSYKRLDMVSYNGGLYVAKKASSGVLPTDTEYWMLAGKFITQIMTTEVNGIGRPDGTTITVDENGVMTATAEAGVNYEKVTTKPTAETAKEGIIYLVPNNNATGENMYSQYILLGNTVECINDYGMDFSRYVLKTEYQSDIGAEELDTESKTVKGAINELNENKVSTETGKGLSTNDFTDTLKTKLEGIAAGANKTTVDSSLSSSSTNPVQNKILTSAIGTATLQTISKNLRGAVNEENSRLNTIDRRTRRRLSRSDLTALKTAITSGNFDSINIKDGDYFSGASGLKYTLGEFNHFKGNTAQYSVIKDNHYAIVVDCMATTPWNSGGDATGAYKASTLRTYLTETALPKVLSDMQALGFTVISRQCLESNTFDSTGVNRWGKATGCTTSWEWIVEQIIALSEPQVYGSVVAGSSFYDVGEANRQLNCFKEHSFMDIADMKYFWLKEPSAASYACYAHGDYGNAGGNSGLTNANYAFGLILIS